MFCTDFVDFVNNIKKNMCDLILCLKLFLHFGQFLLVLHSFHEKCSDIFAIYGQSKVTTLER